MSRRQAGVPAPQEDRRDNGPVRAFASRFGPWALIFGYLFRFAGNGVWARFTSNDLMNLKFHPSALASASDLEKLSALLWTYFSRGGKHIQFNVVTRETLIAAQAEPEKYRNLVVRVAGYSAYFILLNKPMQEEIIARTEHGF